MPGDASTSDPIGGTDLPGTHSRAVHGQRLALNEGSQGRWHDATIRTRRITGGSPISDIHRTWLGFTLAVRGRRSAVSSTSPLAASPIRISYLYLRKIGGEEVAFGGVGIRRSIFPSRAITNGIDEHPRPHSSPAPAESQIRIESKKIENCTFVMFL